MEPKDNLKPIELEPLRPAVETPHADAKVNSYLIEAYDTGRWNSIIDICQDKITSFVGSFPNPIFDGSDVAKLYFSSQAYRAIGEKDKHIACLKILYSLAPFGDDLGGKYRDLLDTGVREYIKLSEDVGIDYLNNFQVTGLFKMKESGCFIATVACGSENAPDVIVLKKFRDEILLNSFVGKCFVNIYYVISPHLARMISSNYHIRKMVLKAVVQPCANLCRSITFHNRKEK